ncbi:hypothetical protein TW1_052 [Pseudoalteromonas phage TW1]|uniref:hypothetical protein n=1 Tax=Pseudoalteromonas phage TW1 TaxID=1366055 RepID=UPI00035AB545|nr:hypothetical protein PP585_gp52 [Pseudoalteromonas phage TW1]AGR46568.1 hypothetical protein TW1_052 [Pseudoalteromonas phage TW1]
MRDLTSEELTLAPKWATHYLVLGSGGISFYNGYKRQTLKLNKELSMPIVKAFIPVRARLINPAENLE